jgi:uncharacterized protein YecE (DUF72 family)
VPGGGIVRIGTAGWTDPTLVAPGVFYPPDVTTPEARLRFYAEVFSTVEVDSTYYGLPSRRNAELWVHRTPPGFVFDVKAHALMTGHPSEPRRLPRVLHEALPAAVAAKPRVYPRDLPTEVRDEIWRLFADALMPLHESGRLGAILLQFPQWFLPNRENADALIEARDRLAPLACAIELRNHRWFKPRVAERTFEWLSHARLPYVIVDEPQGFENSVPPLVEVTSRELAVVRLHGRRRETWNARGVSVAEKYRYLYSADELDPWSGRVLEIAGRTREAHVVFNNCYANYATTNALELGAMLLRRAYATRDP